MDRLGVDIGRVIIARSTDVSEASIFDEDFLQARPAEGAFEAIEQLNAARFNGNIWLVSKCGPKMQDKSTQWLAHHNFFERTGIDPEHLRFTTEHIGKLAIAKSLQLTHFVDDLSAVLRPMVGEVPNLYWFNPDQDDVNADPTLVNYATIVSNWQEAGAALTA